MALSKKNATLLNAIVAAMAVEATPYLMVTEADAAPLVKEGLVETNGEIRVGDTIAARATEKGITLNTETTPAAGATGGTAAAPPSSFALIDGAILPAGRGGRNSNVYPFDTMAVGQSFFVPASEAKPNPAKSLASTVSSATKRYVGKGDHKFGVKSVKAGVAYGNFTAPSDGALVQRSA